MPLYIADYLADTRRLSTLEHGAYMLLIMDYWRNGSLPNDDAKLARIAGLSGREWKVVRESIAPLFHDGWKHKRIDAELIRSAEKSNSARLSAGKRWERQGNANANASADAMQTHSDGICGDDANEMLSQLHSQTAKAVFESAPHKPKRSRPRTAVDPNAQPSEADAQAATSAGLNTEQFRVEWRKFRNHHVSKGSLMADWHAAWRTWLEKMNEFKRETVDGKPSKLVEASRDLTQRVRDAFGERPRSPLLLAASGGEVR
jgi:uncharacterized protein YdaU (DUF1376 family)